MKASPDVSKTRLALALALSACALAATAQAAEPIHPGIAFAMQRDLGIMPGQLPQYLAEEKQAAVDAQSARGALGAHFAGAWVKTAPGGRARLVVSSTLSPGTVLRLLPATLRSKVDVVQARHSLDTLERERERLDRGARLAAPANLRGVAGWWLDEKSNRVVIAAKTGRIDAAVDFAAATGIDASAVEIREVPGFQTNASPIIGGSQYIINGTGACSFGFSARRAKSGGGYEEYVVTAGHCGKNGDAISKNGIRVGTVYGTSFPFNDYAVIRVENSNWYTTPFVKDNSSDGRLSISGTTAQNTINASICKSGYNTGWRCGKLLARNVSANYGTDASPLMVYGLSATDACSGLGDSGGSNVANIGGKWHAQGVTSGSSQIPAGKDDTCTVAVNNRLMVYQPVVEILNANNLYIVR